MVEKNYTFVREYEVSVEPLDKPDCRSFILGKLQSGWSLA